MRFVCAEKKIRPNEIAISLFLQSFVEKFSRPASSFSTQTSKIAV